MTSLVELQELFLPGLTKSTELVGQRKSRTSSFHTLAERHEALLSTLLTGQDSPLFTVLADAVVPLLLQLKQLRHSFSETGNTRKLIVNLLDSYQKNKIRNDSSRIHYPSTAFSEQAELRRRRSNADQAVWLTQNIKDCYETKRKAGAVFVHLTAAYDTIWHRGLTCKLFRFLPDKHKIRIIMEPV